MTTTSPPFPVVLAHDAILRRIHELARALADEAGAEPPRLVAVMEGARAFAEQLCRLLPGQPPYAEVRASSYGSGTQSSGRVETALPQDVGVAGRDVVLLEDIVDTGRTVQALVARLHEAGARRVRVVSLLSKPSRRVVDVTVHHVGFEIPDEFVIGFGMDVGGRYRDLKDIVVYRADLEQ